MEINIPKLYLIFHNHGVPGTWLGWFINQHTSFPQWRFQYKYGNPPLGTPGMYLKRNTKIVKYPMHLGCHQMLWNSKVLNEASIIDQAGLHELIPSGGELTTLEEHTSRHQTYNGNECSSKVLLKFTNLHQPAYFVESGIHIIKESDMLIEKIISIKSGNETRTLNKILNRLCDLKPGYNHTKAEMSQQFKIMEKDDINIYYPALETLAPVYVADFSKLLACDENEYNKLLTAINEKPLDNWKDHVQVIASIFDRYK